MSTNSGLREAPPTRKPSTSGWLASSLQVAPVTEPGKGEERGRGQGWEGVLQPYLHVEEGLNRVLSPLHPRLEANPLTPINYAGALSHCIRDVGLKPSPELFVYFLGLEQEARLRLSLKGAKNVGTSGDRQCGFGTRTLGSEIEHQGFDPTQVLEWMSFDMSLSFLLLFSFIYLFISNTFIGV